MIHVLYTEPAPTFSVLQLCGLEVLTSAMEATACAMSADGRFAAATEGGHICLFKISSKTLIGVFEVGASAVTALALVEGRSLLAATGDRGLKQFDLNEAAVASTNCSSSYVVKTSPSAKIWLPCLPSLIAADQFSAVVASKSGKLAAGKALFIVDFWKREDDHGQLRQCSEVDLSGINRYFGGNSGWLVDQECALFQEFSASPTLSLWLRLDGLWRSPG